MKAYRRNRELTTTTKRNIPRHLLFFDTETYVNEDETGVIHFPLRLGVAYYLSISTDAIPILGRERIFKETSTFIEFILDNLTKNNTLYIYAHNVGFDIMVLDLARAFYELGYESEPPIINNRIFIWTVKTPLGNMTFYDTANYGVWTVSQLGEDMGFPKLSVDFQNVTDDELTLYCRQDVEIIKQFIVNMIQFIYTNDLGEVKSTAASQAFNTYRHRFINKPPLIHSNPDAIALERSGYYGGRTEAYRLGKLPNEPYFYLDVNSMYPYVMQSKAMPIELKGYSENIPLSYLKTRLRNFYVIADVSLKTKHNYYPYRAKLDPTLTDYGVPRDSPNHPKNHANRLVFPIGGFRTVLHHSELERASLENDIITIHRCSVYRSYPIFKDYIDYFYPLKAQYKQAGNISWANIIKLFLNSLYGKFGQIQPVREDLEPGIFQGVFRLPSIDLDDYQGSQIVAWFGKTVKEYREGETTWSCPSIAGAVTSYARTYLLDLILLAGQKNVYYCDTDSLITNEKGYLRLESLIHSTKLGALKLEDYNRRLEIFGCKDYRFGETTRHKGIPTSAKQVNPNAWDCIQFQSFTGWMNKGGVSGAQAKHIIKRRKGHYTKGIVNQETGVITPLVLVTPPVSLLRF